MYLVGVEFDGEVVVVVVVVVEFNCCCNCVVGVGVWDNNEDVLIVMLDIVGVFGKEGLYFFGWVWVEKLVVVELDVEDDSEVEDWEFVVYEECSFFLDCCWMYDWWWESWWFKDFVIMFWLLLFDDDELGGDDGEEDEGEDEFWWVFWLVVIMLFILKVEWIFLKSVWFNVFKDFECLLLLFFNKLKSL